MEKKMGKVPTVFFHASTNEYESGTVITVEDFKGGVSLYHENLSLEHQAINDMLDNAKPDAEPSRKSAIYCFDNIDCCAAFNHTHGVHYYKVKLQTTGQGHPMALVNALAKNTDGNKTARIIEEYWNPKQDWQFNEYLGTEMKIISLEKADEYCKRRGSIMRGADDDTLKKI